ncbi:dTMP kinase [Maricaulis sp. D1M11]|uniref:dTMP kinase n=1 Tax=Maricaulis sp. D1M11 TaxID=3076117 RepID=UPI0039B57FA8
MAQTTPITRGRFISIEGGEGAGKSTLIKGLAGALETRGVDVVLTREPGGTPGAEALRDLLVTGETDRWSAKTEALLMYAARLDHVERLIEPALSRGSWVISDRFADSTLAYQGAAGGLDADVIKRLHALVLDDFAPDLTLVVDLDPDVGIARTQARGEDVTRFEKQAGSFHARLRQAFLDIADAEPHRCIVIDGAQPAETVLAQAIQAVSDHLEAATS